MRWDAFLELFGECPLIEPPMVYAGEANPRAIQTQLSRWVKAGRLIKLARGKYVLAPPYRKIDPPLEYVANRLVYPSYVSFERALAWYGLIPETAAVVTSATTDRPRVVENLLGTFRYRHIHQRLFWGYETITHQQQECVIAFPEKAILDLFYFQPGVSTLARIQEMRFQNVDGLDPNRLSEFARRAGVAKLRESVTRFLDYRAEFLQEHGLT
jgi:predicted transcriptional regulator of viral defense system